ncbi:type II toxin-antitoxin system VapC family toxin [Rhizobiaceae bacterium CRRU44]|uniref:Type II toxin-antitoxin system VapC family toxin n=1 Tax=Ferranicluibacter rubi TaxID=2715133 RepID=A0AA44CB78_9HYPH|nr:type II toxin-antitoxin system VapC family toxin [Ferranicluibacter rubi]NHT74747.1 type II toxin-antitoxin system VapC family toxin [Ferranicluibacter rubi]
MRKAPRIYFDTNAFIFVAEEKSERSALLIEVISISEAADSPIILTSELTLAEVLTKPYKNHDDELISRYDNMVRQCAWLDVEPVSRQVLWYAAVLRSQTRLKLPDAIHLSTAFGCECSLFLTDDRDLRKVDEIYNLRYGVRKAASIKMAAPDIPTLTTLLESLSP